MSDDPRSFTDRAAGRRPRERTEQLPHHLVPHLGAWLRQYCTGHLEQRVALRTGKSAVSHSELGAALDALNGTVSGGLVGQLRGVDELLDAVDYALQLDSDLTRELQLVRAWPEGEHEPSRRWWMVNEQLADLLEDGYSTLQVVAAGKTFILAHRADPTARAALDHAADAADQTAGQHLRAAWNAAYAREPETNTAYGEAVRAVEVAIAQVVSPKSQRPTLGTAVRDLRSGERNYKLVLLDKIGGDGVEPLVVLLERLWEGQKSRHGAGVGTRPTTVAEARAAVQVAVLAVQWLTDGALRAR